MRVIPTTNPRRRPRQARAQATVEAIVKATARVLVEEGYDRASTNRIAQAAGVSIGSLYQYFPSKEALVAALVDNHLERMREVLDRALAGEPPANLGRARATAGARHDGRVPRRSAAASRAVPGSAEDRRAAEGLRLRAAPGRVCRRHLFSASDRIRLTDVDRAVFLLVNAVPSVIRAAIQADAQARATSAWRTI